MIKSVSDLYTIICKYLINGSYKGRIGYLRIGCNPYVLVIDVYSDVAYIDKYNKRNVSWTQKVDKYEDT